MWPINIGDSDRGPPSPSDLDQDPIILFQLSFIETPISKACMIFKTQGDNLLYHYNDHKYMENTGILTLILQSAASLLLTSQLSETIQY